MLELRNVSIDRYFRDVSLTVGAGEVVVLYGRVGSGIEELAGAVYGARRFTSGEMFLSGISAGDGPRNPANGVGHDIGMVPANRKEEAIFGRRSVAENLCAPSWSRLKRAQLLISRKVEADRYRYWRKVLGIRDRNDPSQPMLTLSGRQPAESGARAVVRAKVEVARARRTDPWGRRRAPARISTPPSARSWRAKEGS